MDSGRLQDLLNRFQGDSARAGLAATLCAGGTLAASLTIQQLGETGTATRAQILARFEA